MERKGYFCESEGDIKGEKVGERSLGIHKLS